MCSSGKTAVLPNKCLRRKYDSGHARPPYEEKPNGPGEKKATQGNEAFGEEDT